MLLTGKTVIVTGAGGGLGAGIAAVCSREGATWWWPISAAMPLAL